MWSVNLRLVLLPHVPPANLLRRRLQGQRAACVDPCSTSDPHMHSAVALDQRKFSVVLAEAAAFVTPSWILQIESRKPDESPPRTLTPKPLNPTLSH